MAMTLKHLLPHLIDVCKNSKEVCVFKTFMSVEALQALIVQAELDLERFDASDDPEAEGLIEPSSALTSSPNESSDSRSRTRGPEPETVVIGAIGERYELLNVKSVFLICVIHRKQLIVPHVLVGGWCLFPQRGDTLYLCMMSPTLSTLSGNPPFTQAPMDLLGLSFTIGGKFRMLIQKEWILCLPSPAPQVLFCCKYMLVLCMGTLMWGVPE